MADKTEPQADPKTDTSTEEESSFWDKFESHLDTWFDGKVAKMREEHKGSSSRNGGRTTLPIFLADVIFGKPKD